MIRTDWDEIASEQVLLLRVLRNRRSRETCYASGEAALAARRDGLVPPVPWGGDVTLSRFKEAWPRQGTKEILQNIVHQNVE